MIFFFAAGALQAFVVFECLLRRILTILIPGQRSAVGILSDKTALAVGVSGISKIMTIPFRCIAELMGNGVSMLMACSVIMLIAVAVAENSNSAMALVVGLYNMAIGPVANATLDLFAIANGFIRNLIPIWNAIAYIITQLILQIIGPSMWEFAEILPKFLSNVSFSITSLVLSIVDWVNHITRCTNISSVVSCDGLESCGALFVKEDLNCFANPAYLSIDVMTAGIYTRRNVMILQQLFTDWSSKFTATDAVSGFCSVVSILVNLTTYPLLDFNLYKTIHN